MKKRLKKYLVPHEENGHKPHLLRARATRVLIGLSFALELVVLLLLLPVLPGKLDFLASVLPSVLIAKTNDTRSEYNENKLTENQLLTLAAQLKANDMAEKGYFSHVSPSGQTPWYWLGQAGYNYENAGENLAVNFVDSEDVHDAWMESPTHRANILEDEYEEIGIATAKGQYKGKEAIFVVQYFGVPKDTIAAAPIDPEPILVNETSPAVSDDDLNISTTTSVASSAPEIVEEVVVNNATNSSTTAVLGAEAGENTKDIASVGGTTVSLFKKIISSPRFIMNLIMALLATFILAVVAIKVFVKVKIQYPKLVVNGLTVVVVLVGLILANEYLVKVLSEVA